MASSDRRVAAVEVPGDVQEVPGDVQEVPGDVQNMPGDVQEVPDDVREREQYPAIIQSPGDSSNFFLVCNYGNLQIGDHNVMYAGDGNHDNDDEVISPASTEDVQNLNNCQAHVTQAQLQSISQNIGDSWKLLMNSLSIPQVKVERVYEEYHACGVDEVVYQLLRYWTQQSEAPTVGSLFTAMQQAELGHLWIHLKTDED